MSMEAFDKHINTIICGDCLEVMKDWPDGCVDLFFLSPPYNLGNAKKGSFYGGKGKGSSISYDKYNDDLGTKEYIDGQHRLINELRRIIKPTGAIFYNHKPRIEKGVYDDRRNLIPCPIRQEIVWDRCSGINFSGGFFLPTTERIFIIAGKDWKPTKKYLGWGEVWRVPAESNTPHPAPFPLALARKVVMGGSEEGVAVDCYSGSGTLCVAAKMLGRDYIGIDISEEYCEIARQRLRAVDTGVSVKEQNIGQMAMFEGKEWH